MLPTIDVIHDSRAAAPAGSARLRHPAGAPMKVLALCGSLRAASINAALLRAAARLAPAGMAIEIFDGIGALPLFNPDLDAAPPPSVDRLRQAVDGADALLIASPEYAHGVSGVMKNALDWLVSLESFFGKPVALLNAQPRAQCSDAALRETLLTMSARIVEPASIGVPLTADSLGETGMLASPAVCGALRTALSALLAGAARSDAVPNADEQPRRPPEATRPLSIGPASAAEAEAICGRLRDFNARALGRSIDFTPLWLAAHDEHGGLLGGLVGELYLGWLAIEVLWVADTARGQSIGRALLRQAELIARSQGAGAAFLDSFEWQAQGFYEKQGYREFGRLQDFPPGLRRLFMSKRLDGDGLPPTGT